MRHSLHSFAAGRGRSYHSSLVTMLGFIISDMRAFGAVMTSVIVLNAFAFVSLTWRDTEDFSTFTSGLYTSYRLTLGDCIACRDGTHLVF